MTQSSHTTRPPEELNASEQRPVPVKPYRGRTARSRRRDVSRARSTDRTPGQPPPSLLACRARKAACAPFPTSPVAGPSEEEKPESLDPTLERAKRFAEENDLVFNDLTPLRLALTHRSVLHDWAAAGLTEVHLGRPFQSNERLEFLGDAVLGAIVAEYLYGRFPEADEGTLTAQRVALVRAETLVRWGRSIHLGDYLVLGNGERLSDSPRDRVLAGAFEALVGAIMVDRGLNATRAFVNRFLRDAVEELANQEGRVANPKGQLQEVLQERFRTAPEYHTIATEGPDHAKVFTVEVRLNGTTIGVGSGASKRDAQQAAALDGLEWLADLSDEAAIAAVAPKDEA